MRPVDQRRRHGHALAHALGIFGDQLVARSPSSSNSSSSSRRALPRHRAVQPVDAADEFDELAAGEMIEQQRFVGHQADLLLDLERLLRHGQTQQRDGARVGGARPISILMVVVLPAPFGPRNPKKQPRGTVSVSPSTAALLP